MLPRISFSTHRESSVRRHRLSSRHLAAALVSTLTAAPIPAQQLSIGMSGDLSAAPFRNQIGRHITYVCPATDISPDVGVWGTDVYSFDSFVCLAAIHAGALAKDRAGLVTFVIGPGAAKLVGSTRNGVTTKSYTEYDSTFSFDKSEPGRVDGGTSLKLPPEFNAAVTVVCPPMGDYPYPLWGTDVYADESSICAAAVHSGAITAAAGGPVTVAPAGEQTQFEGSTRNGVVSQAYTSWPTSFRVAAGSAQTLSPPLSARTVTSVTTTPATAPAALPAPTSVIATATGAAPATAVTGVVAQPPALPTNAGRYRVIIVGTTVRLPTKDIPDNTDGIGDEIYAVAVTMLWDRRTNMIVRRNAVRSLEYGDVNAIRKADNRIRAGTGGVGGGLMSNNVVPSGFIPGQMPGEPTSDRLPLVVWEGVLTDGIDALLVVPSLWERDAGTGFAPYEKMWLTNDAARTLDLVLPQVGVSSVAVQNYAIAPGPFLLTLTEVVAQIPDRPIGLTPQPFVVPYKDQWFVVTREKLAGLAVGSGMYLSINYTEPQNDPVLGANYTLSVRVERTQ